MKHWAKALFLLPVAVVAAGGGLLSLCHLLELAGFHPHHHGNGIIHFCDGEHSHREKTPCNGDCLLEMPDADDGLATDRLLSPVCSAVYLPETREVVPVAVAVRPGKLLANDGWPPGNGCIVPTPQRICRFLI